MTGSKRKSDLHIVWFKRDLRIEDHRPLAEACASAARSGGTVMPLYIIEPGLWGEPDAGLAQWRFLTDALADLDRALQSLGGRLILRRGGAVDILASLTRAAGAVILWSHQETGNGWTFARDRRVRRFTREAGINWVEYPQFGVTRGRRDRDGWSRDWERMMGEAFTPAPTHPVAWSDADPGALPASGEPPAPLSDPGRYAVAEDAWDRPQPGGTAAGEALWRDFLGGRGRQYHRSMSSPVSAFSGCSRLSPHLAFGTLSMRRVVHDLRARQRALKDVPREERGSWPAALRALDGRLHWHCHFIQKLESEPDMEFRNLHPAFDGLREDFTASAEGQRRLAAWCAGETGYPMVDACMLALRQTGWINFRMRAMLVSFACHHLGLHWREPALHLARLFTDYEPGIHYSQMQMQSGTTGINTPRLYNPVKQGLDHDPEGRFIGKWLPALAGLDTASLHRPWTAGLPPAAYPRPIVDLAEAGAAARALIGQARRMPGYREAADEIQRKHGSRRSGMRQTGGVRETRAARARAAAARQMTLDL